MRYLPLTDANRRAMLEAIGVSSIGELFDDVPKSARLGKPLDLPPHAGEVEVERALVALAANYVLARAKDVLTPAFEGHCMHECLFDEHFLEDTGVSTLDFAKALIDEGFHPMTIYFPLVVHGALLVEPTESESKESLDSFIETLKSLARRAQSGDVDFFRQAPRFTPRRRLDETRAARHAILRWQPKPEPEAAD